MDAINSGRPIVLKELVPDPKRVLIEYEGPRFFVSHVDDMGIDGLAFCCDEDSDTTRFIVVPTTTSIVRDLENGSISILDSLTSTTSRPSRPWVVDTRGVEVVSARVMDDFESVRHYLPKPHLMLRADLQPILTLRLEGPELLRGSTPRDAIIHAFKNVPEGLKRLLDFILDRDGRSGRPHEPLRALYGLSAQRFAFASLEISFRRPSSGIDSDDDIKRTLDELFGLLEKSICVAIGMEVESDEDEKRVLLEAAYRLAPPSRGVVHSVRFGGPMLRQANNRSLTRSARLRIKQFMEEVKDPEAAPTIVDVEGRIGDIDFDIPSLELRDITGDFGVVAMSFEPEVIDDIVQLAADGARVRAVGKRGSDGNVRMLGIIEAPTKKAGRADDS